MEVLSREGLRFRHNAQSALQEIRTTGSVNPHLNYSYYNIDHDDIELEIFERNTIGTASEATPLLTTSTVGVPVGAVAAAPSSLAVGAGVTLGAAIIGTGLGVALHKGAVYPGHANLGPGNTPDISASVDEDDRIAYHHDIAYGAARNQEDVRIADVNAINSFNEDYQQTGNIHSAIAKTALSIKHKVEEHTGIIYPPFLPISGE